MRQDQTRGFVVIVQSQTRSLASQLPIFLGMPFEIDRRDSIQVQATPLLSAGESIGTILEILTLDPISLVVR